MHDQLKIDIIRSATGCSESEAKLACDVSGMDEEKAIGLIRYIRPRYLVVKSHFSGSGVRSLEGLVMLILEDNRELPVYVTTVVVNYSEDPIMVDPTASLIYWQQMIASHRREQNRYNIESSLEIKEYIENHILPETGFVLWHAARELKEITASTLSGRDKDKKIVECEKGARDGLNHFLEGFFKLSLRLELGMELLTEIQFMEVAKGLGVTSPIDVETEMESAKSETRKETKVNVSIVLHGRAVEDTVEGIVSSELKIGDRVAVDVTERSQASEHLAKLLGLKKSGIWMHAWGTVRRIGRLDSERIRVYVEIARNIFVEIIVVNKDRIKTDKSHFGGKRHELVLEPQPAITGYLVMAGITVFFTIVVKILMVMVNR